MMRCAAWWADWIPTFPIWTPRNTRTCGSAPAGTYAAGIGIEVSTADRALRVVRPFQTRIDDRAARQ